MPPKLTAQPPSRDGSSNPDSDQLALVGRTFTDSEDGKTYGIFNVGFDEEFRVIVAFLHELELGLPSTVTDCHSMDADELLDDDAADWTDGGPGRASLVQAPLSAPQQLRNRRQVINYIRP